MDKKQELQHKLEQCIRDRRLGMEKAEKEIADIRQKIADAEVTYSIGDRFSGGSGDILMANVDGKVGLINQKYGTEYGTGFIVVCDSRKITRAEFRNMGDNLNSWITRIYDARKQVNV